MPGEAWPLERIKRSLSSQSGSSGRTREGGFVESNEEINFGQRTTWVARLRPINHVDDVDAALPCEFFQFIRVRHSLTSRERPVGMAFDGCAVELSRKRALILLVWLEGIQRVSHGFGSDHHGIACKVSTFWQRPRCQPNEDTDEPDEESKRQEIIEG